VTGACAASKESACSLGSCADPLPWPTLALPPPPCRRAGNQSAIKVIRGLATGTIKSSGASVGKVFRQQALVGVLLGVGLSVGGFVRVYVTNGGLANSAAIALSLFLIVMTSVLTGTLLPFGLARVGVDPANAGAASRGARVLHWQLGGVCREYSM
jgi:hypothetical protein